MKNVMTIGKNIKRLREERGLTQKQLAQKTDIPLMSLRNYEACTKSPTALVIQKVALALDCTADEVLMMDKMRQIKKIRNYDFGAAIRNLRKKHGLTQGQFAELAGYSQVYCFQLEGGIKPITDIALKRIAKALCITVDEIWKEVMKNAEKENKEKVAN